DGHRAPARVAQPRGRGHGAVRAGRGDARRARVRLRAAQQAAGVGRVPRPGHAVRAEAVPAGPVMTSGSVGRRASVRVRLVRAGFADTARAQALLADRTLLDLVADGADDGEHAVPALVGDLAPTASPD